MAQAVAQALGLPDVVGRVLAARGVTVESAAAHLKPALRDLLPDPSSFRDMDTGCERLARAVMAGEQIAVFGDYDVDGATSAAVLLRFFRAVGGRIEVYVPDRLTEGYGPNAPALLKLGEGGAKVVVTVDCGTLAFAALAAAADAGLDVIVVDHHLAEPELPRALAVINPNRLDETGAHGTLAAVGVAYLLAVAVNRRLRAAGWYGERAEPPLLQWLDLVALGTVCDMVPLTGLNRAFVAQGLKVMAQRGNTGIAALADVAGVEERLSAYHAGFVLGPRVNAGGRVGRSDLGARLLSTDDPIEARALALELDRHNVERRAIEAMVQEAAIAKADASVGEDTAFVLIAGEGWHPGVLGLVATKLRDRFDRPAVVVGLEDGAGKGSGRSVRGFDLGAAVIAARQAGLLVDGGGHAMAAGFTLTRDKGQAFVAYMEDQIRAQVAEARGQKRLKLDGALMASGATSDLMNILDKAGPFGAGNPQPRFAFPSHICKYAKIVGERHVRCVLTASDGGRIDAIAFNCADSEMGKLLLNSQGMPLHAAGHLRRNNWGGREKIELQIEDVADPRI
ncbi:MAG: single-stranded-DNA-specific exonuclease RecJ [Proteobacteria bacterium]|nr:single-stranded-DNA-specific exonuclease RecJ [Pseudomonadota bacterium]